MPQKQVKRINILEHELVPQHEVLSPEEAERVLKELGIKAPQLPWITIDDPVVKAIKAKPGDIVRITRKSPTTGVSIAYRFVVADPLQKKIRKRGA
jgi:DNA-directed RNA polymerase subunit H